MEHLDRWQLALQTLNEEGQRFNEQKRLWEEHSKHFEEELYQTKMELTAKTEEATRAQRHLQQLSKLYQKLLENYEKLKNHVRTNQLSNKTDVASEKKPDSTSLHVRGRNEILCAIKDHGVGVGASSNSVSIGLHSHQRSEEDTANGISKKLNSPLFQETRPPNIIDTVRVRDERNALPGFDCKECQEFYEIIGNNYDSSQCSHQHTTGISANLVNDVSRHRFHRRIPDTPPGFWDLGFAASEPSQQSDKLDC